MKRILCLAVSAVALVLSACSNMQNNSKNNAASFTTSSSTKSQTEVNVEGETKYVPSGTQLEFHGAKKFTAKDESIKMEMSPTRRCYLSIHVDKEPEVELKDGTLLTVVGYRAETSDLIMTDSNYHQFQLACSIKQDTASLDTEKAKGKKSKKVKRQTSSIVESWKRVTIEIEDIEKMSPVLKIKFLQM